MLPQSYPNYKTHRFKDTTRGNRLSTSTLIRDVFLPENDSGCVPTVLWILNTGAVHRRFQTWCHDEVACP
jgi:hypothetical protein